MSLEALVPPTATNLLDPEYVLARMKLPSESLAALTDTVEEASGLAARFLRFEPAYALWRETFTGRAGQRLYVGARPLWRVTGASDRNGVDLATTSYRADLERHAVVRTLGWAVDRADPWTSGAVAPINLLSPTDTWDWTVEYEAGWWLPTMTGSPPAGVGLLPPEVRRDFVALCRWLWKQETSDVSVRRMRDEGAEVEFFASGELDAETGIPCALVPALAMLRRPQ